MKTLITAALLAASLGGCAIVPLDYGYRGDRGYYRDGRDYYRGDRYWRGDYYRGDGYRRYSYQEHGQ